MVLLHLFDVFGNDEFDPFTFFKDLFLRVTGKLFEFMVCHGNGHIVINDDHGGTGIFKGGTVPRFALSEFFFHTVEVS